MSKNSLEKDYTISISETDCSQRVKPVALLDFMQDLAEKSISTVDKRYSCEELLKRGLGWFLIRYRIEFKNSQKGIKNIKIKTESRGCQKSTFYRDFEIVNKDTNDVILRAMSSWFIVNLQEKSIVNIEKKFPEFLQFTPRVDDLKLNRLKPFLDCDSEKFFEIRYDDLDINNHVNNTVYITWALESLDYEFRNSHQIRAIDVYYKHDVSFGTPIKSKVKFEENNEFSQHIIENANNCEILCLLRIEYEKYSQK